MGIETLIDKLGLVPLPNEGGYYAETYHSEECYDAGRPLASAIYYLLTPDTFSHMHRLPFDELFHFYAGDPVEMLQLHPDGSHSLTILGSNVLEGENPQVVVKKWTWQGARLRDGGVYALLGTTMSPAYDPKDYEHGDRGQLVADYPECIGLIEKLTRI